MNSTDENFTEKQSVSNDLGRLIDEIVSYIRTRRRAEHDKAGPTGDDVDQGEERLLRAALRHLRRHPIPTALLGISATWLLLANEREDDEYHEPAIAPEIEDEIVKQVRGGYDYTNERLRNLVDHFPVAAAAALVGGGLLAAFLVPNRSRRTGEKYIDPEPIDDETMPGEDYGFESFEDDEN